MKNGEGQHNRRCRVGSQPPEHPSHLLGKCERMLSPPTLVAAPRGPGFFKGVIGGVRWAQRREDPSELLLLSIAEPSWGQQKSCSKLLRAAASISIPSQRCGHPGLTLPGVLLSLPAKHKAAEQVCPQQGSAEPPRTLTTAVPQ